MDRRTFLGVAGAGVTTALAGCMGSSSDSPAASGERTARTIDVAANGESEAEPNKAVAQFGIESSGGEASEVRADLAERAEAVHKALTDAGIPDDNITTQRYNIRESRRSSGYQGTHSYTVEIDDVEDVGRIIDVAVDAGADDVGRVSFTLSEERRDEVREEAIKNALDNARSEAETIAATEGLSITGIESVSTTNSHVQPFRSRGVHLAYDAGEAESTTTAVDQGPVSVTAQVEVSYQFSG